MEGRLGKLARGSIRAPEALGREYAVFRQGGNVLSRTRHRRRSGTSTFRLGGEESPWEWAALPGSLPEGTIATLIWPAGCRRDAVESAAEATFLVRDLITTPASDMGPV
jgi:hypothetical protein